jgi:broad specificity phosphatase PhoE
VGRSPGVELSADGVAQAASLADRFRGMAIDEVLSSPVDRAQLTAAPIAAALGLTVEIDAGLDEIDFGEWTGAAFSALAGRRDWDDWNRFRSTAPCPGGETMMAAQDRAVAAVMRASARQVQQVVMVSHQEVVKAVLAHFLGVSLDHLERFSLDPASRSAVTVFDDGSGRVDGINIPP